MVSVIDDLTKVANGRAEIVVEGNDIAELLEATTANVVLQKAAALGLNRPGVSNSGGPYPVDSDGKTDDELLMGKRGPVASYRREYVVLASI
jgi:hypothetical protein